jgi:hypothetical protein
MRHFERRHFEVTWIAATALVGALLACMQFARAQSPASPPLPPPATQLTAPTGQSGGPAEGVIGGGAPPVQRCIEVEIGGETAGGFGCLNQQLKRQVETVNPALPHAPLDARSSDVRVGNVNEAAIRQQLGPNYGHSVIPFRPPPPHR